ncbi:MAG: decaprenyl-phosphate phosphoribosyltransferase [Sedimentisphaerales bacterium]|nr:decaprenyl-phosphate phosphoribosyltransferase [Sedimentisphaerales bacterium]
MKLLQIMRPKHWTKNVFVFAALVFGRQMTVPLAVGRAVGAFICFCLAASAIYILNDIIDRGTDSLHPEKCKRPIAAGTVGVNSAVVVSVLCAAAAIVGPFVLSRNFLNVILAYIVLMVLYSLLFKRIMILDCIVISIGFCLRAIAGAVVLDVFISPWLIICTFALCLFLAFSKRRGEIILLGENSESFRQTLAGYTPELLAHMLDVTSGLAVVCFLLYAMDDQTLRIFGTNNLVYTTPLVMYCIFRFSLLIQQGTYSDPLVLIYKDLPFQIGSVLWILSCIGIIYADKLGFGGM